MTSKNKSLKQIMEHRLEKLGRIKDSGVNPFPYKYTASHNIADILINEESLENENAAFGNDIVAILFRRNGRRGRAWNKVDVHHLMHCADVVQMVGLPLQQTQQSLRRISHARPLVLRLALAVNRPYDG